MSDNIEMEQVVEDESVAASPYPNLVCVEYPGKVNKVDKMVATLGGLETVNRVAQNPNRRLELRFRPDDVFCKPTCGERSPETAFLLRVKRKKK